MKTYFETYLEEKGIALDTELKVEGQINLTVGNVVEFIYNMPTAIQKKVANTIAKIEFQNGNVINFLTYLAKGMANGF